MLVIGFCAALFSAYANAAPNIPWTLVSTRPHDRNAFTQGLVVDGTRLIEGVGLYGRSGIVIRDVSSLRVLAAVALPADHFGEGVAVIGERIIQLTWQNGVAHVFDSELQLQRQFRYAGEGWGLTFDGKRLIRSDGTARLRFHDPDGFRELGSVLVTDGETLVDQLNELEFVDGLVYANVWHRDEIAIIDPASGVVRGWLDLSVLSRKAGLVAGPRNPDGVLNGIAVIGPGRLLITGKLWPQMFEIEIDRNALAALASSIKPTRPLR